VVTVDLLVMRALTITAPDDARLLDAVDWTVRDGERWVVLGPNGAGKSTLLAAAAEEAAVDTVGVAAPLPIPDDERVLDVVLTATYSRVWRGTETYDDIDEDRALGLLARLGCRGLAPRAFGTLSVGECQRVLIARSLMADPELLLLDEPSAGLDLAGREALLHWLGRLAADPLAPSTVLVTHHVEEIPTGTTHALLLRSGRVVASGPIETALTSASLSACFGLPIVVDTTDGRFAARFGLAS
jgi:iron complex transport system ATP-binding protein